MKGALGSEHVEDGPDDYLQHVCAHVLVHRAILRGSPLSMRVNSSRMMCASRASARAGRAHSLACA
jgi:hypothetical protein